MVRRKTHDEYIRELKENGIQAEPLETYVNNFTKIPHLWKACGHVTEVLPSNVLKGHGCGKCPRESSTKKTHAQYLEELKKKDIQVEPLEHYVSSRTKIPHLWRCGHVTNVLPGNVLLGQGCGRCAKEQSIERYADIGAKNAEKKRLKAAKELDQRIKKVHGTKVRRDSSTPYVNGHTKMFWFCDQGHIWEAVPRNIKSGRGCPTCGAEKLAKGSVKANARKSKLAVISAYSQLDGRSIQHLPTEDNPKGFPTSTGSQEKWKCLECSHVWVTNLNHITSHDSGCPRCANGNSKGETFTRELLEEYGVEFQSQKKFPDLKRVNQLSYDFYIPSMNILIECQGEQHYKPSTFFHGENAPEGFAYQQERDHLKREYASQNGYLLLEISYKDYSKDRITEILQETGIIPNQIVV